MLLIVRTILVVLGTGFLLSITGDLFHGHITYSIGETEDEQVITKTIAEALAVWVAFGSLFVAMILGGAAPRLYVEKPVALENAAFDYFLWLCFGECPPIASRLR